MMQRIQGGLIVSGPGTNDVVIDCAGTHYETGFKFNTLPFGGMTLTTNNALRIGSAADIKLVPPSGYTVVVGTTGNRPSAAAALRGALFLVQNATPPDTLQMCIRDGSNPDTYHWYTVNLTLAP